MLCRHSHACQRCHQLIAMTKSNITVICQEYIRECLVLGSFISALMYCSLVSRGNCVVKEHLFNRMDSLLAIGQAVPEMAKLLFEVTQCAHTPGCMLQALLSNLRPSHSFIHGYLAVHVTPFPACRCSLTFRRCVCVLKRVRLRRCSAS